MMFVYDAIEAEGGAGLREKEPQSEFPYESSPNTVKI
jgi:hypothetical protein